MDILTLLRANIRRKKGTFLGIMFLMILVSSLLTMLFSIKKNVTKSIDDAFIEAKVADVFVDVDSRKVTDDMLASLESHPLVERVRTASALLMDKHYFKGKEDNQSWLIVPLNSVVTRKFTDDFTAYEDSVPVPSENGMYVPQGVATKSGCKVGDEIRFVTRGGEYTLTIEGFIVEPICGSAMIGWKTVFVAPETFEKLVAESDAVDDDTMGRVTVIYLDKKADCGLSDSAFAKRINLDTGVQNYAYSSETKTQMKYYTNLFSEITCSVMIVFAIILAAVVVIIMAHNIAVTIEENYTELGILKAQGFTKGRIRLLYALMYILAQLLGSVIGTILAIPLVWKFGNIFQTVVGIIAPKTIDFSSSIPVLLLIILVSCLMVLLATRRIGKVSPVKALTGERRDVYFDSLLTLPVSGNGLSMSLAYRQFSSNKRRYFVAIIICAVLMFFMLTVNLMGTSMRSKSAMEAMGEIFTEVVVRPKEGIFTEEQMEGMDRIAKETAEVDKTYFYRNEYVTIEESTIMCSFVKNPENIKIVSGRAPLYDNEIVITEILEEELGRSIGDKVTVSRRDDSAEYIITGIFASMSDTGRVFSMGWDAGKKLGVTGFAWYGISLKDDSDADKVGAALEAEYGDAVQVTVNTDFLDEETEMIRLAVDIMRYMIYVFSVIFVLVVVSMICSRVFAQERRDLGIYKAIGFTSGKLRLLFALRFFLVAIIGSAIGAVLSLLFSFKVLNRMLRSMGVTNFVAPYTTETVVIPVVLLVAGFFLFAYLVSRKVKKVEIRELVIE
ncbi:MAG: ABC transporter permease [Clostridiales bacterium]|nr:ABC transporter permease [Clostridiales bacterium]